MLSCSPVFVVVHRTAGVYETAVRSGHGRSGVHPAGLAIEFGPPPGISLTVRIATQFPDASNNAAQESLLRALLSVRKINGQPAPAISTWIDVQRVANAIGDHGLDVLGYALIRYWPPLTTKTLPAIKKNLRQPGV